MAIQWDEANINRLLNCQTDQELTAEFPGTPIETLKRRKRLITNSGAAPTGTIPEKVVIREEVREVDPKDYTAKDRKIARLEEEIRQTRKLYKSQTKQTAGMDALVEAIYEVVPALPQVIVPEPYITKGKEIEEESAVLCLGDWHYGQVVDPEENGGISVYNIDVAKRRIDFTVETAIKLATEKLQGYSFKTLHVFGLGDFVSGIIHDETVVNNEVNIVEQVLEVSNLLAEALLKLAMAFPEVQFAGVVGNHGRTEQKMYWNQKAANNYDYMVYKIVERQLANQPNISFNCPKSFWAIAEVENTKFLVTHGDTVRGWGSIPFYGLQRLYTKMRTLQQDFGADFHHVVCGHLHNPNQFTIVRHKMFINGALVGGDPYSIGAVSAASDPVQMFFGVHPRRGITWQWEINSSHIR